jgi:hypothetical protein
MTFNMLVCITGYTLGERRVDGGWHIAMSCQLYVALCTLPELSQATKLKIAEAYELLFAVHHALRNPLPRELVRSYDLTTSQLLHAMVQICAPSTKSECCSTVCRTRFLVHGEKIKKF